MIMPSILPIASSSPGIGLRGPHAQEILSTRPPIDWLEIHPENYVDNEPGLRLLEAIRSHYPISLHGVSLSLGSTLDIDRHHLEQISSMARRLEPTLVSEHLSWSRVANAHFHDLLPLPYTEEALATMTIHVDQVQSFLGRRILIENPSAYLRYRHSTMEEAEFLAELVQRTGCGVLLDVNNLHVSAHNVGLDIASFFSLLPPNAVAEIHVAGHATNCAGSEVILIDDHGSRVSEDVWSLCAKALEHFGPTPTLVEWDSALPSLEVLLGEAARIVGLECLHAGNPHACAR
jgi:uncharacterized protein (UPF0276 family)